MVGYFAVAQEGLLGIGAPAAGRATVAAKTLVGVQAVEALGHVITEEEEE